MVGLVFALNIEHWESEFGVKGAYLELGGEDDETLDGLADVLEGIADHIQQVVEADQLLHWYYESGLEVAWDAV